MIPEHASGPHDKPSHVRGTQRQRPSSPQTWPSGQLGPHQPPQPSSPQLRPRQRGTHPQTGFVASREARERTIPGQYPPTPAQRPVVVHQRHVVTAVQLAQSALDAQGSPGLAQRVRGSAPTPWSTQRVPAAHHPHDPRSPGS